METDADGFGHDYRRLKSDGSDRRGKHSPPQPMNIWRQSLLLVQIWKMQLAASSLCGEVRTHVRVGLGVRVAAGASHTMRT